MRRKFKVQWLFLSVLITVTVSGSFLFRKNQVVGVDFPKTTGRTTAATQNLQPFKHVTKSLKELGEMDEINKYVLFFNNVPKCGSEIIVFLLQKLQGFNNYRHVRLKGGGEERKLTKIQQEELVYEIYDVIKNQAVPVSFDRHVYFTNFTSYDKQLPTYINFIRDPVDKMMSGYTNKSDRRDFLKCYSTHQNNCSLKNGQPYDLTIPYFCGHETRCMLLNDDWALKRAKNNVEKYFSVVGILEELNATLEVMENKIPNFFKGVQKFYQSGVLKNITMKKKAPTISKSLRQRLKDTLVTEYEFYEWIKQRLFSQLQMLYGDHNSH